MMKIKGWRREGRENRVNRFGSGEPTGSRTPLKGGKGPVFPSFATNPSLSKLNLEREALPSLFNNWPEKMSKGADGTPPARWPAVAPPCRSLFSLFFLKIFLHEKFRPLLLYSLLKMIF